MSHSSFFATSLENLSAWAETTAASAAILDFGCCFHFLNEDEKMDSTASVRQANVLIISGALTQKAVSLLKRYYDQMPESKMVLAVGTCACGGGIFADSYAVVTDINQIVPVDVYVAGCPPTAENFHNAIVLLQQKRKEKTR